MTAEGPKPELLKSYGLVAGPYDVRKYPMRTKLNVKNSDGTVLFGKMDSPGCKLTINLASLLNKPYITNPSPETLVLWIVENKVEILNVAGNREHKNTGIKEMTKSTIKAAYQLLISKES